MRSLVVLGSVVVFVPVLACYAGYGYYGPPPAQVQVQQQPPPQGTVQVDVNAQQQQPVDPNAAQPAPGTDQVADTDPSALSDFTDVLAPYGTWQNDPQYGTIWIPNPAVVGPDFEPYVTAGHWVYDNDYTWVSDWDWGWAPFHYGRWFNAPGRGWAWIPGKEYAGAWVTWRNGDDGYGYVGWAPTPPSYYWRGGAAVNLPQPWYPPRYDYIQTASLFQPTFRTNIIRDRGRVAMIEQRTRPYTPAGTVVVGGNTRMVMRGPPPVRLGLNASVLPRAPMNHPGMTRAYQFSHTRGGQPVMNRTVTPYHPPLNEGQRPENRYVPNEATRQQTSPQQQRVDEHESGRQFQYQQQQQQPQQRFDERESGRQAPQQQQQQPQQRFDERESGRQFQYQQQQQRVPAPPASTVRRPTQAEMHEQQRRR